jgi:hypothetical protein
MTDQTVDQIPAQKKRPTLLTVLCILTWVVSAYYIITTPFDYFFSDSIDQSTVQQMFTEMMEQMDQESPEAAEMMEGIMKSAAQMLLIAFDNAGWLALFAIIVAGLSAFGAYLMWNLRKTGFYVYVAAKIIGLIVPLVFLGVNLITMAVVAFGLFIGLIFIVLYAVNLKHMR